MTPEQPGQSQRTAKHAEARGALDEKLHPAFDALVNDYQFYASVHYASRFVSYLILADLVRAGWRPSAPSEFPPLTVGANRVSNKQTDSTASPQELKKNE